MDIREIQESLRAKGLDGWLFFDHHRRDVLACLILQISEEIQVPRRWYFLIPAVGEPRKLLHRIESHVLDELPGEARCYSSWSDQYAQLATLLSCCSRVAMQYSPKCAIRYVSLIDAGTAELVRSLDVNLVSSADLIQEFEARWTKEQLEMHLEA